MEGLVTEIIADVTSKKFNILCQIIEKVEARRATIEDTENIVLKRLSGSLFMSRHLPAPTTPFTFREYDDVIYRGVRLGVIEVDMTNHVITFTPYVGTTQLAFDPFGSTIRLCESPHSQPKPLG